MNAPRLLLQNKLTPPVFFHKKRGERGEKDTHLLLDKRPAPHRKRLRMRRNSHCIQLTLLRLSPGFFPWRVSNSLPIAALGAHAALFRWVYTQFGPEAAVIASCWAGGTWVLIGISAPYPCATALTLALALALALGLAPARLALALPTNPLHRLLRKMETPRLA